MTNRLRLNLQLLAVVTAVLGCSENNGADDAGIVIIPIVGQPTGDLAPTEAPLPLPDAVADLPPNDNVPGFWDVTRWDSMVWN